MRARYSAGAARLVSPSVSRMMWRRLTRDAEQLRARGHQRVVEVGAAVLDQARDQLLELVRDSRAAAASGEISCGCESKAMTPTRSWSLSWRTTASAASFA